MSKTLKNTLAGFAVAALLLVGAGSAKAATIAELQALIADLTSQLAALSGGSSSCGTYNHTVTLMVGSTGSQVMAMQAVVGATADGNFGPMTKAKVQAFQASKGLTADGVVGPMTGAAIHTASMTGCTTGGGNTGGNTSGPLSGGAGAVEEYTLISNLQNEEVGEDEEDVEVAGLEITADEGSDLEITAVKLVFDEGTATSDFEDYASEVSVWFAGEEVARMDADEFNDDNDWTRTISLDNGAIVREGDTEELTVAISGVSNLDTNDEGDTWTVDFRSVRFEDADGAVISEDPATAVRTFSFESFSASADVELKISSDNEDINDARIIEVDATEDTDGVEVLSFTLEAEGNSDIDIKKFGVNVDVGGAATNTDGVISSLALIIDGEEVGDFDCFDDADCVSAGTDEDYIFDDVDFTIPAGETVDASIEADFFSIADSGLAEGDTVAFAIGETETDQGTLVEAEDEAGDELGDSEITGSVSAETSELRSIGIRVTLVNTDTSASSGNSANDDAGVFVIEYDVEAFGGDVYVSDTDTPTTATSFSTVPSDQVLYTAAVGGTATASGLTGIVDFEENTDVTDNGVTNGVLVKEDKTGHFSLEVTRTNTGTLLGAGSWKVNLMGVSWATSDTATQNVYDFDLGEFETDTQALN